jgi:hypothetical protein
MRGFQLRVEGRGSDPALFSASDRAPPVSRKDTSEEELANGFWLCGDRVVGE